MAAFRSLRVLALRGGVRAACLVVTMSIAQK